MTGCTPDLAHHQRIYVLVSTRSDGRVAMRFTASKPITGDYQVASFLSGMLAADPTELVLATALPTVAVAGSVIIGQKAAAAISGGTREIWIDGVAGVVAGGVYLVAPVGRPPAGYRIEPVAWGTSSGRLFVRLDAPLLAIGAEYLIPCRLVRLG